MIKSNGVVSLTREEALKRAALARSDDNHPYGLGRGGRKPQADRPYDANGRVDCSGAVCWFLGVDRLQNFPGEEEFWWSTDSIEDNAADVHVYMRIPAWFKRVPSNENLLPGDLLVYGDYKVNGQTKQGHVAMVNRLLPGFKRGHIGPKAYNHRNGEWTYPEAWYNYCLITHATPSHRTKYGNVIAETNAYAFRARKLADGKTIGGTFVRYTKFKPDALSAVVALPVPKNPPVTSEAIEVEEPLEASEPLLLQLAKLFPKQRGKTWVPRVYGDRVAAIN